MFSAELERYQAKKDVARKVIAAENYMAATFWSYIKDADVYNYSYTQWELWANYCFYFCCCQCDQIGQNFKVFGTIFCGFI